MTYDTELSEGHGTIWNFSVNGWRLTGDVPLRIGQTCTLIVHVSDQPSIIVGAIVRWGSEWDQEYGLETVMANEQAQNQLKQLISHLETGEPEAH